MSSSSSSSPNDCCVNLITVPNAEVANQLSDLLVGSSLAACVNQIPGITSVYRWEGKICRDTEILLLCKSQSSLFQSFQQFVCQHHPYKVPEIISIKIDQGNEKYIEWIKENTKVLQENNTTKNTRVS
jgi:periplasmic divalent cation tolerance protein